MILSTGVLIHVPTEFTKHCRHIHTTITVGLILIHHEFGSKTLIDELSAIGRCVSCTKVSSHLWQQIRYQGQREVSTSQQASLEELNIELLMQL